MGSWKRKVQRRRKLDDQKRRSKMMYKLRFAGWEGPKPDAEAPKCARVFVCLLQTYHLQPQDGGKNVGEKRDLDTALEITRLVKRLRDPDGSNQLRLEGGEYTISQGAYDTIRADWREVRKRLGKNAAENVLWMEEFLDPTTADEQCGITVLDPNKEADAHAEVEGPPDRSGA